MEPLVTLARRAHLSDTCLFGTWFSYGAFSLSLQVTRGLNTPKEHWPDREAREAGIWGS